MVRLVRPEITCGIWRRGLILGVEANDKPVGKQSYPTNVVQANSTSASVDRHRIHRQEVIDLGLLGLASSRACSTPRRLPIQLWIQPFSSL